MLKICLGAENNGHAISARKKTSGGADKEQERASFSRRVQTSMEMCAFFSPDMFGKAVICWQYDGDGGVQSSSANDLDYGSIKYQPIS